jgi:hypothetical protein
LAAKQYKARYEPQDGDITVLACHASAFPKELYEPLWSSMFERAEKNPPGHRIRSIFIADVSNQGQSGVINEQKLGNERRCILKNFAISSLSSFQRRTMIMLGITSPW